MNTTTDASASGTYLLGGELPVHRLGLGSMQLTTGNGFGPPRDRAEADAVLKRAVALGITLIDTADAYGPWSVEELIASALHPYRDDLVIATKGGFVRDRNGAWITNGRPSHLREALEGSLRRLRLETIDLYQLHRVDAAVPLEDQVGTLAELRGEGKIRHIGLSEVSVGQLTRAEAVTPIATVQNLFNLADRKSADVLAYAAGRSIGFIPWFPLATGGLARSPRLSQIAARQGISASQVALAWLLQHSDNMLPIPGTAQVPHLEDNVAAAGIRLDAEELAALDRLA